MIPRQLENMASMPCSFHVGTLAKAPSKRCAAVMPMTRALPSVNVARLCLDPKGRRAVLVIAEEFVPDRSLKMLLIVCPLDAAQNCDEYHARHEYRPEIDRLRQKEAYRSS